MRFASKLSKEWEKKFSLEYMSSTLFFKELVTGVTTSLELGICDDVGCGMLAAVLRSNSSLKELTLHSGEQLLAASGVALAEVLASNETLEHVWFLRPPYYIGSGSDVKLDGKVSIPVQAITTNQARSHVFGFSQRNIGVRNVKCCDGNDVGPRMGDFGAALLAKLLETNTSLTDVRLHHARVGKSGEAALMRALAVNNTLVNLELLPPGPTGDLDDMSDVCRHPPMNWYSDMTNTVTVSSHPLRQAESRTAANHEQQNSSQHGSQAASRQHHWLLTPCSSTATSRRNFESQPPDSSPAKNT